jgi:hypothetical protein
MQTTHRFSRRPILAFAALAAVLFAIGSLHADTITLKNGTRYQGRVLKDEGDSYLLEIQVTRSIKDERRVLKADIEKIERANPLAEDFKPLAKLADTPDMLDDAGYQARIDKINKFLGVKEYKFSKQYKAARQILRKLEAERKAIAEGGVKINGEVITASEYKADAVAIDAGILYAKMLKTAKKGNLIGSMRIFDTIEKHFPQTTARQKAATLARKVLAVARKKLSRAQSTLDKRLKERDSELQRMIPSDRARNKAAAEKRKVRFKALIEKERQEGIKWLTVDDLDRQSIQNTLRRIDTESQRLDRAPYNKLKKAPDDAYREAWEAIPDASEKERVAILSDFKRLNLPDKKYIDLLTERDANTSLPEPAPDSAPGPAKPAPAPAPAKPAAKK